MQKEIIILSGIPCSGKSTWTKKFNYPIISRDDIRENIRSFPNQPYIHSKENEDKVTKIFNNYLLDYLVEFDKIILDNTHCKEKSLDNLIKTISEKGKDYKISIKFFDCSLLKSYIRNYVRYFLTGKWIPLKVIYNMNKSYKKINKKKYAKYLVY